MSLSADEVKKLSRLARLELAEADVGLLQSQLSTLLDFVAQIQEIETEGVEPLAHPLPVRNAFREDVPVPSLPVDLALANAPQRIGDFFGVPAVFTSSE